MADLAERGSLCVRELQSTLQLGLQDEVFGDQIFVPRPQLLVRRPRDVSQDAHPIHNGPPAPTAAMASLITPQNVADRLRHHQHAETATLTRQPTIAA
jgi:hypothetical protein